MSAFSIRMTDRPRNAAMTAGFVLLGTVLIATGIGAGIGALLGIVFPGVLVGLFAGFAAGFLIVHDRFRDI